MVSLHCHVERPTGVETSFDKSLLKISPFASLSRYDSVQLISHHHLSTALHQIARSVDQRHFLLPPSTKSPYRWTNPARNPFPSTKSPIPWTEAAFSTNRPPNRSIGGRIYVMPDLIGPLINQKLSAIDLFCCEELICFWNSVSLDHEDRRSHSILPCHIQSWYASRTDR